MPLKLILRLFIALSFLFSAYTKYIAPGYFEITLMDQGIAHSRTVAAYLTRFFIALEFFLGLLLLTPIYTRKALAFTIGLLLAFSIHLGYLWAIGSDENCGCFGKMITMTPEESLLKNIALIALSGYLYRAIRAEKKNKTVAIMLFFAIIAGVYASIPLPNFEGNQFAKFSHFEKKGRKDLTQGEQLVAVFNLDCEHCQEAATLLAQYTKEKKDLPPLFVLYFKEGSTTVDEFEQITQSHFPYAFIDVNDFFDLIGDSPPRLYYLNEGKAVQHWDTAIIEGLEARFYKK